MISLFNQMLVPVWIKTFAKAARLVGLAAIISVVSPSVLAWDGAVTGVITQIDGVGEAGGAPGNLDFRVYLSGVSTMCSGATDGGWGFINATDPNYKGLAALLMTAFVSGKSVTLYSNKVSMGAVSFCHIGYVLVRS